MMFEPGQPLNQRFQLKQRLSQNGNRQTWLAIDLQSKSQEWVIVKLLGLIGQPQWELLELFNREASILQQLDHPQVPQYRQHFSIAESVAWSALVQQYIPGDSLKSLLDQGYRFTETEIRKIAEEVLQVLMYLHELSPPVLHRDIKPSNLIWSDRIHLVDFGSVQDRAVAEGTSFMTTGTYGYAALEQFGGRAVASSDLYSLGATLIHLMTGVAPSNLPQKDLRIQFADQVSLDTNLIQWVEVLIAPDVNQRFRTARQAWKALQARKIPKSLSIIQPTYSHPALTKRMPCPAGTEVEIIKSADELVIQQKRKGWFTCQVSTYLYAYFTRDRFVTHWTGVRQKQLTLPPEPKFSKLSKTSDILDVSVDNCFPGATYPQYQITVQAGVKSYGIAFGLTWTEQIWLLQEIRDWLGLEPISSELSYHELFN